MSKHRQTIKTTEATRRPAGAARRQLRCNHTNPSTDEEKRWIYVLPASVLVVAWMLSVSVRSCMCQSSSETSIWRPWWLGVQRHWWPKPERKWVQPPPLLDQAKTSYWTMDSGYPLPPLQPTFKGLPAQNSCSEYIMEGVCFYQWAVCSSELQTHHCYSLATLKKDKWKFELWKVKSSLTKFVWRVSFLQHSRALKCSLNTEKGWKTM